MYNGTLFLNNNGSRWIELINGKKPKITLKTESGKDVTRTVIFYESFGNFAVCHISYKGRKIRVFADETLKD